jgi:excisionase family DNA binding protein
MNRITMPDILTLEEISTYLRIPIETVENQALKGNIPGQKIEGDWRFLKTAVDDWLRAKNSRLTLLSQAGAFANDDSLAQIRETIYQDRKRPEVDNSSDI